MSTTARLFLVAFIHYATCVWACYSGQEQVPTALDAFKTFTREQQSLFSKLESFEMAGTIKVEVSDDFLKANGGQKTMRRSFVVSGDRSRIREEIRYLDDAGKVDNTVVYHLDSKQVVVVDGREMRMAKIFNLATGENVGLFNTSPAFLEYAFLHVSIGNPGIPALLTSDLAAEQKWVNALVCLQTATKEQDGILRASLINEKGSCLVDLEPRKGKDGYQIRLVSFYTNNKLSRKIEVLDYFRDKQFENVGKRFRVSVYEGSPSKGFPAAIWDFEIDEIKLNNSVPDESLIFNPTSVDKIYDGDHDIFITVPK